MRHTEPVRLQVSLFHLRVIDEVSEDAEGQFLRFESHLADVTFREPFIDIGIFADVLQLIVEQVLMGEGYGGRVAE